VSNAVSTGSRRRVAILHYSAPPIVGGVETTIHYHASLLAESGYEVHVIAGRGEAFHPQVMFRALPEVDSRHPEVLAVKEELDGGRVSDRFVRLQERIAGQLRKRLAHVDVLIAHNVFTLHKNLPLTTALHRLLADDTLAHLRTLAWHHDLAWVDSRYAQEVHPGYPWDLLRQAWPGVVHVTVSEARRSQLGALYGLAPDMVHVVPPGIDPSTFFRWTVTMQRLVQAYRLLDADLVLLLPARITRRKNIQLAVQVTAALHLQTGLDVRLLVSGPPGPHNPSNLAYLNGLLEMRRSLELSEAAHFVYELQEAGYPLVPDDDTMSALYLLADALIFPSLEEGFGIPLLEAGLVRLPVFCSDIPPLQATGGTDVHYFSPTEDDPADIAAVIAQKLLADPACRLRRRVIRDYSWAGILRAHLRPLIEGEEMSEIRSAVSEID